MDVDEKSFQPLAARMRPHRLSEFVGQQHLFTEGKPLWQAMIHHHMHSMILWGPPGSGKTTLAYLLAENAHAHVEAISAVLAGVKDIRAIVDRAQKRQQQDQQSTIMFVDEVHRFNKAQQDAFLPFVENGTVILVGTTTENPSFELNNALLSRVRVYVLKQLTQTEIMQVIDAALKNENRGFGKQKIHIAKKLKQRIAAFADGDARQALNALEVLADFAEKTKSGFLITEEMVNEVLVHGLRRFDKYGEYFYDLISALHKSVRGSAPDASLYWLLRLIDGGCDPHYIARRILRMASEDIGNADPRALSLAVNAWQTYDRLGSPEGELALAQAVIYLACAPKSNAVYLAFNQAEQDVKNLGTLEVPLNLRNAPTGLMKNLGYGKHYRYAHDEPEAYAAGENYFPDGMTPKQYYHPADRGLESKIKEKLSHLRELDKSKPHE